jgi:1-acyl-sn-glycerol-3-phosphate acyltransferase
LTAVFQKIIYETLRLYCKFALFFFFRQWQVRKLAPIPNGPVIFVANHQNAFLDAVVVICSTHRNPWALARGNVFKKKWAHTLLTLIQMMPVYRFRDGFDTLRKNEAILDQCANLLKQGKSVLIFGEGNHNEHYNLRPLQKGFVRMAQVALQQNTALQIVPVGVHYEAHRLFRSRVLVSFGEAIPLAKDFFDENPVQKTEVLLKEVAAKITPLILSIPENNYETIWQRLRANRNYYADLVTQLQHEQQLVDSLASDPQPQQPTHNNILQKILNFYYTLNHWPARAVVRSITGMPKLDPQFIGSIKFAAGIVVVPAFYVVQISLVAWLSGSVWITLGYAVSLPVSVALFKPQ